MIKLFDDERIKFKAIRVAKISLAIEFMRKKFFYNF